MLNTTSRLAVATLPLIAALTAASPVHAASLAVELACASDYYAYCSKYNSESAAARSCMDRNGNRLSQRCINALVRSGEVSKSEVKRRAEGK